MIVSVFGNNRPFSTAHHKVERTDSIQYGFTFAETSNGFQFDTLERREGLVGLFGNPKILAYFDGETPFLVR